MPISPSELARLEQDFASGRNPHAYIPLCRALRRTRQYPRALEICEQGLRGAGDSDAGRLLRVALMVDSGRYADAVAEADKALAAAPDSAGLLAEKARALIRLRRYDEASELAAELTRRNPMDAKVQLLNGALSRLRASSDAVRLQTFSVIPRANMLSPKELAAALRDAIQPVTAVLGVAVVPVDAGEPSVMGAVENAEAALVFCQEVSTAALELDAGNLSTGILETERRVLMIAQRHRYIVCLAIDPGHQLGKVLHRFQIFLVQMFPEDPSRSRTSSERIVL